MNKLFILILIIVLVFSGCSGNVEKPKNIPTQIDFSEEWNNHLDDFDLDDYKPEKIMLSKFYGSEEQRLFTFYDYYDTETPYHRLLLAVEFNDIVYFENLYSTNEDGSYHDEIYCNDLDGDGDNEIIINSLVGVSGGAGQYVSRVYDITRNGFSEVFCSTPSDKFDTGFACDFRNGYKMIVSNINTKYQKEIYFNNKEYSGLIFDEEGKVVSSDLSIMCDNFYTIRPVDIDDDNVFELECYQYVSLYGHSDFIGDAKTVLKLNENNKFEIAEAEFIPR